MKLIGHNKQIEHLNRVLARDVVASSYIFSGPADIGKRTLAEYFARAIIDGRKKIDFAEGSERDYYGDLLTCAPLVEIKKVAKKSQKKKSKGLSREKKITHDITVEQMRDVVRELSLSSLHGHARVLIIDDADRMGRGAQNAFLKTVEEPPHNAYIIFITSDASRLLSTMRSRCQMMSFGLLNEEDLREMCADEQLRAFAMGRPGLLAQLQKDDVLKEHYSAERENSALLQTGTVAQRLHYAEELAQDKEYARDILAQMQWHLRRRILQEESYAEYAKIMRIEKMRQLLRTNVNTRMALEELFLHL